jgi:hypothetical protein
MQKPRGETIGAHQRPVLEILGSGATPKFIPAFL